MRYEFDPVKAAANLAKHGLDFADADRVLNSRYRLDVPVLRNREERVQSMAYVFGCLAVLTVVHTVRFGTTRIISFRRASKVETEVDHEWLENDAV